MPLINRLSAQAASSRGGPSLCLRAGSSSVCQERGPLFREEGEVKTACSVTLSRGQSPPETRKSHPSAGVAAG